MHEIVHGHAEGEWDDLDRITQKHVSVTVWGPGFVGTAPRLRRGLLGRTGLCICHRATREHTQKHVTLIVGTSSWLLGTWRHGGPGEGERSCSPTALSGSCLCICVTSCDTQKHRMFDPRRLYLHGLFIISSRHGQASL